MLFAKKAMKIINGVYRYILRKHLFIKYPLNQDSSACVVHGLL